MTIRDLQQRPVMTILVTGGDSDCRCSAISRFRFNYASGNVDFPTVIVCDRIAARRDAGPHVVGRGEAVEGNLRSFPARHDELDRVLGPADPLQLRLDRNIDADAQDVNRHFRQPRVSCDRT